MGGKAKKDNSMMLFQQQQAAEARAREDARQGRLNQGTAQIDQIFSPEKFNDEYYNKYASAMQANDQAQLTDQYALAKKKTAYDLARAGLTRSSTAADAVSRLAKQNDIAGATVASQVDAAKGTMRNNILSQKNQALQQLYSTEDPTVAANTATTAANNAQLASAGLTPLGQLFTPIAIGGIKALAGYQGQSQYNQGLKAASGRQTGSVQDYGTG
jgi:hypothetical protein